MSTAGPSDHGGPEPIPAWAPWTAPAALLAALALTVLAAAIIGVGVVVLGGSVNGDHSTIDIAGTFFQDAAFVVAAVLFATRTGARVRPEQFGLRPTRARRAIGLAVLGLAVSLIFTAIWSAALHDHQKEQVLKQLGADHENVARYVVAFLVCVVAPIAEETFFRGYYFTALRNWRGTPLAVLLTGLTFGAVHAGSAPVVYLVPLAFLGMVLCVLYLRTRSLYPCIGLHVVNNCLAFGVSLSWGWQIPVLIAVSLGIVASAAAALARLGPLRQHAVAAAA